MYNGYDTLNQPPNTMISHYPTPQIPNPFDPLSTYSGQPVTYSQPQPFDPISTYSGQPVTYSDPYGVNSNWVVNQSSAIQPLSNQAISSTSYNVPPNYNFIGQKLVNRVPKKKPKKKSKANPNKPSVNQPVRCDVCKIECNNVQMYEKHVSGRKHNKAILNLYAPAIKAAALQTAESGGEGVSGDASKAADLEVKKQKLLEGGTSVQSLRLCTICNIACNGEIAFSDHVAGRKHVAKERALGSTANPDSVSGTAQETTTPSKKTKKRKNGASSSSSPATCEVCKINCTSNDGLQIHFLGKKHKKNVQKLQAEETPNPSMGVEATSGPTEKPKPKKKAQINDVNVKKQKVLECGADESAVRTCTLCNVVCNSEIIFKSHLDGKKHKSMVKQAEGSKVGLQVVYPPAV